VAKNQNSKRIEFAKAAAKEYSLTPEQLGFDIGTGNYSDPIAQALWVGFKMGCKYQAKFSKITREDSSCIVGRVNEHGIPFISNKPYMHEGLAAGLREAERLAAKFQGSKFSVWQYRKTIGSDVVEEPAIADDNS
jgi:hypothetical protein